MRRFVVYHSLRGTLNVCNSDLLFKAQAGSLNPVLDPERRDLVLRRELNNYCASW
jgi:hypothetical protein